MAGPSKKPKRSSNEDAESEGNSSSFEGTEIDTTFEGRSIEPSDFPGIKIIFERLFYSICMDISGLADLLVNQKDVGCVLKQACLTDDEEDDEESADDSYVFGITSVLNLTQYVTKGCVKDFFNIIENKCKQHSDEETFSSVGNIIANNRVGLIIHERLNMGSSLAVKQLAFQTLTAFQNDINGVKSENPLYEFDYYFYICSCYKAKNTDMNVQFEYFKEEDKFFADAADFSFQFSIGKKSAGDMDPKVCSDFQEYRKIILFKSNKLAQIISRIQDDFQG